MFSFVARGENESIALNSKRTLAGNGKMDMESAEGSGEMSIEN